MMSIELAGVVYEIEGLLYAGRPACSLRKARGGPITTEDFDRLSIEDEKRLRVLVKRHVEAVALLAGLTKRESAP